jgi:transposase
VPIGIIGRATDEQPTLLPAPEQAAPSGERQDSRVGGIEIDLPSGVRLRVDSFVNEKALSRVLRALKGSA